MLATIKNFVLQYTHTKTKETKNMTSLFTPSMNARIKESAPMNYEKAKNLSQEFGGTVTPKGVVSKCKHLGVEYVGQVRKAANKKTGPTKAEVLEGIRASLSLSSREGDLTKAELLKVFENIS